MILICINAGPAPKEVTEKPARRRGRVPRRPSVSSPRVRWVVPGRKLDIAPWRQLTDVHRDAGDAVTTVHAEADRNQANRRADAASQSVQRARRKADDLLSCSPHDGVPRIVGAASRIADRILWHRHPRAFNPHVVTGSPPSPLAFG